MTTKQTQTYKIEMPDGTILKREPTSYTSVEDLTLEASKGNPVPAEPLFDYPEFEGYKLMQVIGSDRRDFLAVREL